MIGGAEQNVSDDVAYTAPKYVFVLHVILFKWYVGYYVKVVYKS